jgi:hypothetical protein
MLFSYEFYQINIRNLFFGSVRSNVVYFCHSNFVGNTIHRNKKEKVMLTISTELVL